MAHDLMGIAALVKTVQAVFQKRFHSISERLAFGPDSNAGKTQTRQTTLPPYTAERIATVEIANETVHLALAKGITVCSFYYKWFYWLRMMALYNSALPSVSLTLITLSSPSLTLTTLKYLDLDQSTGSTDQTHRTQQLVLRIVLGHINTIVQYMNCIKFRRAYENHSGIRMRPGLL